MCTVGRPVPTEPCLSRLHRRLSGWSVAGPCPRFEGQTCHCDALRNASKRCRAQIAKVQGARRAGRGIGDACRLLFLGVFARQFGSDVLGKFWYAMAIGAVVGALITRVTSQIMLRDTAQNPDMAATFIGAASSLQLVIAVSFLFLLVAMKSVFTDTARAEYILLINGRYQIVCVMASISRIYFSAIEKVHYNAVLERGHKSMILVCEIAAIYFFDERLIVLLVYPLAALTI